MKKVKFSIIVPIYNVESYIAGCISSVKNQVYSNWELILVNDGSSDASAEICQKFCEEDSRIILINQENQGVSQARNAGIQKSTGDYITFIDGDDSWDAEVLSVLSEQIVQTSEKDIWLAKKYVLCYPSGERRVVDRGFKFSDKCTITGEEAARCIVEGKWSVCLSFVRKELVEKERIYFNPMARLGEDADWMFRVCLVSNQVSFIENEYYRYYYNREGSAMTTKSQAVCMSYLEVVKSWIEMYVKTNTPLIGMITRKLATNCAENIVYVYDFDKQSKENWRKFVMEYKMYDYLDDKKCKTWKHFCNQSYFNIYIWGKAMRRKIPAFCRKAIKTIVKAR